MRHNPFYPWKFVKSVYAIPYERLYEAGYRGIIFDIDNTLFSHRLGRVPKATIKALRKLRQRSRSGKLRDYIED
jgi:predicted HAD superfamily phosphohydrolase YqeG